MRVAIIDDETTVCRRLKYALSKEGFEVETFQRGEAFLRRMKQAFFQLAFIDLKLPDMDGMEILSRIKRSHEYSEVIVITGYGSIETAIEAIKKGAYHYLTKPFELGEVCLLARGAKEKIELREENR